MLFGSNGNSCTIYTVSYLAAYVHTYSSEYRDAGRTKEMGGKKSGHWWMPRVIMFGSPGRAKHACLLVMVHDRSSSMAATGHCRSPNRLFCQNDAKKQEGRLQDVMCLLRQFCRRQDHFLSRLRAHGGGFFPPFTSYSTCKQSNWDSRHSM